MDLTLRTSESATRTTEPGTVRSGLNLMGELLAAAIPSSPHGCREDRTPRTLIAPLRIGMLPGAAPRWRIRRCRFPGVPPRARARHPHRAASAHRADCPVCERHACVGREHAAVVRVGQGRAGGIVDEPAPVRAALRNLDFVSVRGLTAHPVDSGPAHVDGTGDRWEEPEPPGPCALARENSDARRRPRSCFSRDHEICDTSIRGGIRPFRPRGGCKFAAMEDLIDEINPDRRVRGCSARHAPRHSGGARRSSGTFEGATPVPLRRSGPRARCSTSISTSGPGEQARDR